MKTILSSETMDIPDGIKIKVNAKIIEVEGPRGKLVRNFKHLNLDFELITDEETGKRKLKIESWFGSRKTSAAIRTALSHVENLITGVTKGYRYKMRFVYAHFPINASITNANRSIEIRNFLGEKRVISLLLIFIWVCFILLFFYLGICIFLLMGFIWFVMYFRVVLFIRHFFVLIRWNNVVLGNFVTLGWSWNLY